ncbi:MAG: patatin-like phospholipase family protein [Bacteroidales bacterium]|nr:patatin-like phospholipase family protein [Bacteroidales bacterium]
MKLSNQSKIQSALLAIQDFLLLLSKCWLSIVMLLVGAYAFLLNDQGQDVVTAFNEKTNFFMSLTTALCMLFWGIQSWFGARLALNLSDIGAINYKRDDILPVWLPIILGFLSTTIFYISYWCFSETQWWVDKIILLLPIILYCYIILNGKNLANVWNKTSISGMLDFQIDTSTISDQALKYAEVTKVEKWFFVLSLILFPLLVIAIWLFPVSFPTSCTPTIVILLGIAVWTALGTGFMVCEKKVKSPLVLMLVVVILIFAFSFINNNHTLRTIDTPSKTETITSSVKKWVNQLPADSGKIKTLYIACGEGGGIRAAYWTASILASLTDSMPKFSKHLFALSTVSGGSLGATAYNSILKFNDKKNNLTAQVRKFIGEDYLSPVTAAFLFPDAFQRFLFFPFGPFDRARYLEQSWEIGWAKNFPGTMNPFSSGMQKLYANNSMLPNLFINSAHTESGRRSVVSNLSWDENEWRSNNINKLIGKDMPLSTATLLSARFPILTPGAKIIDSLNNYWGTLVDGGYYDNYGTVTAANLYYDIRKVYKPSQLKIVVLMILNGDSVPENPKPIKCAYELLTVPTTFLNARTVRPENSLNMLSAILTASKDTVITIQLARNKGENLPLGWCLSNKAMDIMDKQLESNRWKTQKKQILELMH